MEISVIRDKRGRFAKKGFDPKRLKLVLDGWYGCAEIQYEDHNGHLWHILKFNESGDISLTTSVPKHLGFTLDKNDKVKISKGR